MDLKPITFKAACEFVKAHHRHHKAPIGHKFSIGCTLKDKLLGVIMCGRPVARALDDGYTLEVNRLCTLGGKNVCSFLYSAAARCGKAMGYTKIITYILEEEKGISLRASNWVCDGVVRKDGKGWNNRVGRDNANTGAKTRWHKELAWKHH